MILWKFTLREVRSRPGRATLTLLSIVIGVAAVVAVTIGTATTNQACREMYSALAGRAAFEVVAAGDAFYDHGSVAEIGRVPGVKAAVPSIQKLASLHHGEKVIRLLAIGIDPARDKAVRDYELKEGRFFQKKYDAMLETGFARGLGVKVGDEVRLGTLARRLRDSGVKPFRIVGLLSPRGAADFNQGGVIFLPLATAQQMFDTAGSIDTLSIVLAEGADEQAVADAIRRRLPAGLNVRSPMARSQLAKENIDKVEKGLDFAYVTMLFLAGITILNTFLMNVGERRRQLAVLRAIGATRRQLIRMLLLEGLAMGIVGTILGAAAGVGGAYLLTVSMSKVYSTPMPALRITFAPFAVVACLGPAVSLLAMFAPAWIAGRISPLEGMRFVAREGRSRLSGVYVLLAVAISAVTGSVMWACVFGWLPIRWMIISGVVFTAAFILLVPVMLGGLGRVAALLISPLLRTEGRIAHRQVLRRRVRATLTIGVLYIAVSTAISLGTTILNNVDDIHAWVATALKGDFFVRAVTQDLQSGLAYKMPEDLVHELRHIDGVSNVDSVRFISGAIHSPNVEGGRQQVTVVVRDFTDKGNLPLMLKSGDPATVRRQLAKGEAVIGTTLANRLKVGVGDTIDFETREGVKHLPIAATTTAYMVGGMVVYLEGQTARHLLNVAGVDMYIVDASAGKLDEVAAGLKTICQRDNLLLNSFAEVRRHVDDLTAGVVAGLWGLLALALIVGAFATFNTLTMNVLEQTRELALLRVVAMTRRQIRKTIFGQAIIIGLVGMTLGLSGGMIGAYVINLTSVPMLGYAPAFTFQPSLLLVCFCVGMAVIVAAAWIPAERAARLNLLIALQYE
jgi:putative ABC transport system permease protein